MALEHMSSQLDLCARKLEWLGEKLSTVEMRLCKQQSDLSTIVRLSEQEFHEWLVSMDESYYRRVHEQLVFAHASNRYSKRMPVSATYNALISAHVFQNLLSYRAKLGPLDKEDVDSKLKLAAMSVFSYKDIPFRPNSEAMYELIRSLMSECDKEGVVVEPLANYGCVMPYKQKMSEAPYAI